MVQSIMIIEHVDCFIIEQVIVKIKAGYNNTGEEQAIFQRCVVIIACACIINHVDYAIINPTYSIIASAADIMTGASVRNECSCTGNIVT